MKYLTLCIVCGFLTFSATAQCPPNLDFEEGSLANWQCSIGDATSNDNASNLITLNPSAPVAGRHELISASNAIQKDPYGGFPTLCPYGGNYSVKLGNTNTGGEAEGISYTFTIPADVDTLTFTYFYAVVFEDPQHEAFAQPRFFVTAYDVLTGEVINCASYDYISTSSLPGFTVSKVDPTVLYKDWSPVSLQFFGLNGREVRLEFKTADCTLGGHFGYAYLDVGTACSNILATAPYCVETNSLILNAPYGFKDYTWYSQDYSTVVGTGQSITFSPPPSTTGTYFVDMVPYPGFGCRDTASATVKPLDVPPRPLADSVFLCQFQSSEPLTAIPLPGHDLLWYTDPTGGNPYDAPPTVLTHTADTFDFYVSQKKLFGCESFRVRQTALVRLTPSAAFSVNDPEQCEDGNEFSFVNASDKLSDPKFVWDFGDGNKDSSMNATIKHSYDRYGYFNVSLNVLNQPACSNMTMTTVRVMPKPVADFDGPSVICDQDLGVVLTDKSYVPASLGTISSWSWDIDETPYSTQHLPQITVRHGGSLPVNLTVTSTAGCRSDTLKRSLPVRHKPVAAFVYQSVLCENELVKFDDLSYIPSGLDDEYIVGWNWLFNGAESSAQQRPSRLFNAGQHHTKLVVETNYGCRSEPEEKGMTVNPKPSILLSINDSCVFKDIIYSARDLGNNVSHWFWDFGAGLQEGAPVMRKKFAWEGDQSFKVITQTDMGCKDTINRAFSIYDNDSFAGNDTIVAKNQPVYLNAMGGADVMYTWSPAVGLDNPNIEKPVASLDRDMEYKLYSITNKGCERSSSIFIKRYAGAEIYIPNAFTPNGDGTNDLLKVFPVGYKSFDYMAVYNRYGQQVYLTRDWRQGWDGTLGGVRQDAGNYVVAAKMTDYNGQVMLRKGVVILVR